MVKVMICQPMSNIPEEVVLEKREAAKKHAAELLNERLHPAEELEIDFIENYVYEDAPAEASNLWYLGRSIQMAGTADFLYFVDGWKNANGCKVESLIAELYEIPILYKKE